MYEPENIASYQRQLAGMARRADDAEALGQLVDLQQQLAVLVELTAQRLNSADGISWTELAAPLGVSRQAARQLYGGQRAAVELVRGRQRRSPSTHPAA